MSTWASCRDNDSFGDRYVFSQCHALAPPGDFVDKDRKGFEVANECNLRRRSFRYMLHNNCLL